MLQDNINDGIMNKATRNNPLYVQQKEKNREICKVRYIVEQSFGIMKGAYNFTRARDKDLENMTAGTAKMQKV